LLRALIFDFDGVIVDSEGLIFQLTQQMAAREGWTVSEEEYYRDYLALDDRGIIEHLYQSHGRPIEADRRDDLVRWKFEAYQQIIRDGLPAMPGAVEFIRQAAARFPLAIATGSLRIEIEHLLVKLGLRECFRVLATADDCQHSKPDPEVYVKAIARLRDLPGLRQPNLEASQCLAIEDAPLGVVAAKAAGMKCLALAHSRPVTELGRADWVYDGFAGIDLNKIAKEMD
jgi:beta-phosphoglucomutase